MEISSCLRSESINKVDLCYLIYHQRAERSTYQILIMKIGEDKPIHDKNIFGRLMRNFDIRICAIGVLGLWLLARFKEINDVISYDFV